MGSYERGSRAISLARTIEIANLFTIPLSELIEEPTTISSRNDEFLIFDLRRLREISNKNQSDAICKINAFLGAICARRRDWNGEVLTLRSADLDTLTLLLSMTTSEVQELLSHQRLLIKAQNI